MIERWEHTVETVESFLHWPGYSPSWAQSFAIRSSVWKYQLWEIKWKCTSGCLTFKGVLIHDEQTVNLHLFTEGGLVGRSAAGEELAGADAAGESLEGCGFMRQDRKRGRNREKPNKGYKAIQNSISAWAQQASTAGTIYNTRWVAFKIR